MANPHVREAPAPTGQVEQLSQNKPLHPEEDRRQIWLSSPFRCRAISTVRLRKCRLEQHEQGIRLRFQKSDVVCDDVEFDSEGNPAQLTGCRSPWLRVPKNNRLKRIPGQDVWSGSHSGWRWKDGEKYCCPGMWLEAPNVLKDQLNDRKHE